MQTIKDFWSSTSTGGRVSVSCLMASLVSIFILMLLFEGARIVFGILIACLIIMVGICGTIDAVATYKRNKRYKP